MISHDVLIVGGGLAGLRAAVAAGQDRDTAVVSQTHPLRSNAVTALEGVNAALDNDESAGGDSVDRHVADTLAAGDALGEPRAAEALCEEAPGAVLDLERWGAPFDRTDGGLLAQRSSCGHGVPRTCFAGEHTGHALLNTLFEQVLRRGIKIYDEFRVVSLVTEGDRCLGVIALVPARGELVAIGAKAVVLATGGCGRIYKRSGNARHCTGSGIAVGYRAGVPVADMEFIRFHPLSVGKGSVLISEELLAARGRLVNAAGERFMEKYAPDRVERAEADVIARAIATEIAEGRAFEDGCVHLDLRNLPAKAMAVVLGHLREEVIRSAGVDPAEDPVPVAPAAQFFLGGLVTDEAGATRIRGLLAAGECAWTGAHGARPLKGNLMSEALVFGRRAGEQAAKVAGRPGVKGAEEILEKHRKAAEESIRKLLSNGSGEGMSRLRARLAEAMWSGVGVVRSNAGLGDAMRDIAECRELWARVKVPGRSARFNSDLMAAIEVGEMLDIAEIVAMCAVVREESRGSHFRADEQKRNDAAWRKHTFVARSESGPRVWHEPVQTCGRPAGGGGR